MKKTNKDQKETTEKYVAPPSVKEEITELLCRKGHDSSLEDGVVITYIRDENEIKEILAEFRTFGYDASYGFRSERKNHETL